MLPVNSEVCLRVTGSIP